MGEENKPLWEENNNKLQLNEWLSQAEGCLTLLHKMAG